MRAAFNRKSIRAHSAPIRVRNIGSNRGRLDAWNRAEPLEDLLEKPKARAGLRVLRLRKREIHGQKSSWRITFIHIQQSLEVFHQQACTHQQNQRKRNLRYHERAAQATTRAACGRTASAFLQTVSQIGTRSEQGGG